MKKTVLAATVMAAVASTVAGCGSSSSSKTTSPATSAAASGAATAASSAAASGPSVASKLILGGPPEFKTRPDGIPGLASHYGVTFGSFKPLDAGGPLTINALKNGQIDAGDIFTTDPSIKADNFVALADPKNNYSAQNVLPLLSKSKDNAGVEKVLNAISAKITTADLITLNTDVITDKQDPKTVADAYLKTAGLDTPSTDAKGSTLVVGSANFQEDVTLAEIYAEALKDAGATVTTKLNIGSRETYIPGLEDGSINLIPEYSGVLLQYFDKSATAITSDDVLAALKTKVPSSLTVLDQSQAEDKDAIVVTAATAAKYHLTSIADLANPAS